MAGKKEIGINVASTGEKAEPQQVSVTFDEEKLDALLFYMREKGMTMDEVLQEHMGELYRSFVPANARRYLDRNDPEEQKAAERIRGGMTPEEKEVFNAARREKRKAEKQAQKIGSVGQTGDSLPAQEGGAAEPREEGQGMTLGGLGA